MDTEAEIVHALNHLGRRIAFTVDDGLNRGLLRPTEDSYARDRIEAAEQTEYGLVRRAWATEFITKESWRDAAGVVAWNVVQTDEYKAADEVVMRTTRTADGMHKLLEGLTEKLVYEYLEVSEDQHRQVRLQELISVVLKHIAGSPVLYTSEVRLKGVAVLGSAVEFVADQTNIRLRAVTEEDFANEKYYRGFREHFHEDPTAVLHINFESSEPLLAQKKIWQAVTVLRLFNVGGVRYLSYSSESESLVNNFGGGILANARSGGYKTYKIEDGDDVKLESFWQQVSAALPVDGYEHIDSQVEPVHIAYQRYSDALLTLGASGERRIADAVMGLEGLFLKGSEKQESVYRLRMRAAKVLALLGHDPHYVVKSISDAYTIRSAFVHGDVVSAKDKRRIEERHGSIAELLHATLDQLRVAIVLFTVTKTNKEEFIALLDQAFIDQSKLPDLDRVIDPLRTLV